MQNILISGNPLAPCDSDRIAQIAHMAHGSKPAGNGWRIMTGGPAGNEWARVAMRYEIDSELEEEANAGGKVAALRRRAAPMVSRRHWRAEVYWNQWSFCLGYVLIGEGPPRRAYDIGPFMFSYRVGY